MPIDVTFDSARTIDVEDEAFIVTLTYSYSENVLCRTSKNIRILSTPDATDPIENLEYALNSDDMSGTTVNELKIALPFDRIGTVSFELEGELYAVDRGVEDTINSGTALLTYDTRKPDMTYSDLPIIYESMEDCDFIVGFNQIVENTATDPADASQSFNFDGASLGTSPTLWGYLGTGTPRLPIPDDLVGSTNWEPVRANTYFQYFAVRFADVPDGVQGVLNIALKDDVFVSSASGTLLAVTPPPPVPQPQMINVPVIGKLLTQNLGLTEDFSVDIPITGGTATTASVRGLAVGSVYSFDETTQMITISGNANTLLTDAMWVCNASGPSGDAATVNQTYNYIETAPVVSALGKQLVIVGSENEILIPIGNEPSDGNVITELIGMEHELYDEDADGSFDHMRIHGTPSATANFSITEGSFVVNASNTGGDHSATTEFRLGGLVFYGVKYNSGSNDEVIVFSRVNDGETISETRTFFIDPYSFYVAVDSDYLYGINVVSNRISIYDKNATNGSTPTRTTLISGASGNGIAIDDDYLYAIVSNTTCRVYNKSTGSLIRSFTLESFSGTNQGAVIDGNDIIVYSHQHRLHWYDKRTNNNQTATRIKYVDTSLNTLGNKSIGIYGTNLFLTDTTPDTITIIDKDTADTETATVLETWNVPSAYQNMHGLTADTS